MSDIYQHRASIVKALAHPSRLRIIDILLKEDEICVCDMVEKLNESQSSVSKHLSVLKDSGLVTRRKDGLMVFYNLRTPCIRGFLECLDRVLFSDLQAKQKELFER